MNTPSLAAPWHRLTGRAAWPRSAAAALAALPVAAALLGAYVQVLESAVAKSPDARMAAVMRCATGAGDEVCLASAAPLAR